MKTVSNNIKEALKQPTTQRKGRILVNGNYYDVFNVEYYADCYNEGKVIGNAIASQLDFEIPYIEKFDTFKYFDGVWTGSNYEYVDFGTFTVFDEKDEDDFNKHITAFDNLIKFNTPYEQNGTYPKTLYAELHDLCQQAGVALGNLTIPNGDFIVSNNQFVNGESRKTVLKQICAISGTYGIVKNDVLYLQLRNNTNEELEKYQHTPTDWKRRSYGINQVIIGDSQVEGEYVIKQDDADIALNGVHKLEILDNLFAYTQEKRQQLINALYEQVHGFGYIPYETQGEWLNYLEIGDTITIDDVETLVLRINGKSPKAVESTISAPAIIDSSIEYVDNTNDIEDQLKRTERIVDKNAQAIIDVVEQTTEQNIKISQITQTVDEINAKISDIADITISGESTFATFTLDNINQSEPIQIIVKPINENISYLYPSINLFPSANLFPKVRTIRFTNRSIYELTQDKKYTNYRNYYVPSRSLEEYTLLVKGTDYQVGDTITGDVYQNKEIDYELPDNLLYYDSNTYDEFYLDYDSHTCQITKRCQYNSSGLVEPLSTERIVEYEYPTIALEDGDYTLTLLGYEYGYLFIRLMAKNIYTSQFYTKVETDSRINQKADEIELGVSQTLSNYSNTSEMNAAINVKANEINSVVSTKVGNDEIISKINQTSESITINANKLNLTGYITASDLSGDGTTTIDGSNIKTGTISSDRLEAIVITTGNLSAQTINGNQIYGGTIEGTSINIGNDNHYLRMGNNWTKNPEASGLNLYGDGGIVMNGLGFNGSSSSGAFTFSGQINVPYLHLYNNATIDGNMTCYGDFKTNRITPGGNLAITTGGRTGYGTNPSSMYLYSGSHITINAAWNSYVYIGNANVGNTRAAVDSSGPSSRCLKKDIKEFKPNEYDDALKLLNEIKLYDYKYKYKIHPKENQYGFIIDDLLDNKLADKFLYFKDEKAGVNINNYLDYSAPEEDTDMPIIEFKRYDEETLIKYLLVVCKALQNKIESLEEKYEQTI